MTTENFPQVWKNAKLQSVAILFPSRVEYYGGEHSGRNVYSKSNEKDFDPEKEIESLRGNGFIRVSTDKDTPTAACDRLICDHNVHGNCHCTHLELHDIRPKVYGAPETLFVCESFSWEDRPI